MPKNGQCDYYWALKVNPNCNKMKDIDFLHIDLQLFLR